MRRGAGGRAGCGGGTAVGKQGRGAGVGSAKRGSEQYRPETGQVLRRRGPAPLVTMRAGRLPSEKEGWVRPHSGRVRPAAFPYEREGAPSCARAQWVVGLGDAPARARAGLPAAVSRPSPCPPPPCMTSGGCRRGCLGEGGREEVATLRSKFEADKKRIEAMRQQRKFRPY